MLDNNCTPVNKCLSIKSLFSQEFNKCQNCNLLSFPNDSNKISGLQEVRISLAWCSRGSYACRSGAAAVSLSCLAGERRRVAKEGFGSTGCLLHPL